jgi:hypothetical protein
MRSPQPGVAVAEDPVAAVSSTSPWETIDAIEVPGEDLLEALARDLAVADQQRIELRRDRAGRSCGSAS